MDYDVLGFLRREIYMRPPSSGTLRKSKTGEVSRLSWRLARSALGAGREKGFPASPHKLYVQLCLNPFSSNADCVQAKPNVGILRMQPDTRAIMRWAGVLTQLGHVDQFQWQPSRESPWLVHQNALPDST